MRYILAAYLVCAIGMPAAFATPAMSSGTVMMVKLNSAAEPVKHKVGAVKHKASRYRRSRSLGGIHPLVGSGDY